LFKDAECVMVINEIHWGKFDFYQNIKPTSNQADLVWIHLVCKSAGRGYWSSAQSRERKNDTFKFLVWRKNSSGSISPENENNFDMNLARVAWGCQEILIGEESKGQLLTTTFSSPHPPHILLRRPLLHPLKLADPSLSSFPAPPLPSPVHTWVNIWTKWREE
jgi:hypothetical protein